MAELGVDALVKAIRGEEVSSLIDSGAALVTPDNMADFQQATHGAGGAPAPLSRPAPRAPVSSA